jgi:hypothetical protein
MICASIQEVVSGGRAHQCENKHILSLDDPLVKQIGFVCLGCGEEWHVDATSVRDNPPPPVLLRAFSVRGRLKLADLMTRAGNAVNIWEEEQV